MVDYEDRWTVWRHSLHTLLVLLLISVSNELILGVLDIGRPTFGKMYLMVTTIGLFPIMLGCWWPNNGSRNAIWRRRRR